MGLVYLPTFTYIYLHLVFAVYCTPEIQHRYQELPCLKGFTFSTPSFWVSMLVFGSVNCSKTEKTVAALLGNICLWHEHSCWYFSKSETDFHQIHFLSSKTNISNLQSLAPYHDAAWLVGDPSFIANLTSQKWVAQSHVEPKFSWLNSDVPSFGGNLFCPRHPVTPKLRFGIYLDPKNIPIKHQTHLRRYAPGCLGLVDFGPFVWCKTTPTTGLSKLLHKAHSPCCLPWFGSDDFWFEGRSCCVRNYSLYLIVLYTIRVFPKIMVPPNHPF